MFYSTKYPSPIGMIVIASDGKSINGLWLEGQKYFAGTIPEEMIEDDSIPVFEKAKDWLRRYFLKEKPSISELPLAPIGGEFRQGVWEILCKIPYGETVTYGEIARKMAVKMNKPKMSAQAVGGAVGHNPISIIIPCHRVVGTNNSLTGYAGGIGKKVWLLSHEGIDMKRFTVPKKGTAV